MENVMDDEKSFPSFPEGVKIVIRDEKENAKDNKEKTYKNKADYDDR